MKKITLYLILSLIFITININAQFSKNNAIYLNTNGMLGNYKGSNINLQYMYKQKYSFKLLYTANIKTATEVPNDYNPGSTFIGKGTLPLNTFQSHSILVGKVYPIDKFKLIRANISIGVSYNIFEIPSNFTSKDDGCGWFGCTSNYSYDIIEEKNIGLVLNPSIEIPLWRYFGFSLAPYVNINAEEVIYGGQFGIIVGLLRAKK